MRIKDIQQESHERAIRKGFYDPAPSLDQRLLLIQGELSEAYEEVRKGFFPHEIYFKDGKPEGFAIEIADTVIRILDMCGYLGIDLEKAVRIKSDYNETRPHKHGKKF